VGVHDCFSKKPDPENIIAKPSIALALKWIMYRKGIENCVSFDLESFNGNWYGVWLPVGDNWCKYTERFKTDREAESCLLDLLLDELIKLCKEGGNA